MKSLIVLKNKNSGFTLIEILLVIGLLSVVIATGAFADINFYNQEIRISEQAILISILQKARNESMNNIHNSPHGIHIQNNTYVLFYSMPYDENETSNQTIQRNPNITITGLEEIIFEQLSGNTQNTGTIAMKDEVGVEKLIFISSNGLIDW